MALAEILSTITSLRQLPEVAFELGFSPTWHELSLGSLKLPAALEAPAAIVGRRLAQWRVQPAHDLRRRAARLAVADAVPAGSAGGDRRGGHLHRRQSWLTN